MRSRYDARIDVDLSNNTHAALVRQVGESAHVLELGAASGYMTRVLVERGCAVTAVEVDPVAAVDLEGVAEEVVVGDLDDPTLLEGLRGRAGRAPYDVVLAGDVLEHLARPQEALRRAVELLGDGGRVVLSVPHVHHVDLRLTLLLGRFHYTPTGLLDETHLRFFTRESLLDLVRGAGLVPTRVEAVLAPAFSTELAVPWEDVPTEALKVALEGPDPLTYQLVLTAEVATGDPEQERRAQESLAAQEALDAERTAEMLATVPLAPEPDVELVQHYLRTAEADLATTRAEAQALRADLHAARALALEREEDADALRAEVAVARRELEAACREEGQARRLQTRVGELTEELDRSRAASGNAADARDVSEIVADFRSRAELAAAASAELAELKGSRAFTAVHGYRTLRHQVGHLRRSVRRLLSR